MRLSRLFGAAALAAAMLATTTAAVAEPPDRSQDPHSDNIEQLAQIPIIAQKDDPKTEEDEEVRAEGSDLAFQGNLLVAGSYSHGFALFKILKRKPYLKQISIANCHGPQSDVSIWGDLVFVSVDTPMESDKCGAGTAPASSYAADTDWEGVRIFDISNRKRPRQVTAVNTDCGSHTHTLAPGKKGKLYLYVSSYPLGGQGVGCNAASHRKISIVEVDPDAPQKAKVIGTHDVSPTIGCHDITTFPEKKLAFAACISESQVWDISNPAQPETLSHIYNPMINIHHSTAMTWDGKYIVIGDEFSGAVGNGCAGSSDSPVGAMWFYDISDPEKPARAGYFGPPRSAWPDSPGEAGYSRCTTHNFNVLPMKDPDKYYVTSSYYVAGLNLIDFSDPAAAKEIAYYLPMQDDNYPSLWAAYWYNGRVYANDFESKAGVSAYEVKGTGAKQVRFFKDRLNPQVQIANFK